MTTAATAGPMMIIDFFVVLFLRQSGLFLSLHPLLYAKKHLAHHEKLTREHNGKGKKQQR